MDNFEISLQKVTFRIVKGYMVTTVTVTVFSIDDHRQ